MPNLIQLVAGKHLAKEFDQLLKRRHQSHSRSDAEIEYERQKILHQLELENDIHRSIYFIQRSMFH